MSEVGDMTREGRVCFLCRDTNILYQLSSRNCFKQVKAALAMLQPYSSHVQQPTTWALTSCSAALSKNDVYSVVAALGTKSSASVTPHLCITNEQHWISGVHWCLKIKWYEG